MSAPDVLPLSPGQAPLPPGPPRNFPLGILPEVRQDALGTLRRLARTYGPVVRVSFGPFWANLITHPDGVRRVLQDNVRNYTKEHFSYGLMRRVAGNGLLTSEGDFWLRQRRLAQPAFHKQRLVAMAARMVRAAEVLSERWDAQASTGEPLSIAEEMMGLTLRVVSEALFSTQVEAQVRRVGDAFTVLSTQTAQRARALRLFPPILPTPYDSAWRRAKRELDTVVYGIIAERHKRNEDTGDLLSMLMLARDEDTGERMSDLQLHDEVLTMMVAGHETTANTLSWVWALLERHPEVEVKLHTELDHVLAGRSPGFEDLARLSFTRQVIEEAMRLYPPVYIFSRKVAEDDVICGFRIPKGTWVDLSPWVTHRDPALWERPDDFLPERFAPEASAARPRFAYFPFSGGPRQCIGSTFAMVEGQLLLATFAQRFRLRSVDPAAPLVPEPIITLRPRGGLPMRIERRAPASRMDSGVSASPMVG